MIELIDAGRDPEEVSREFAPTAQSIRNWVVETARSDSRPEKVEPTFSDEMIKLRVEERQLR